LEILILGLILFLGIHLIPAVPPLKSTFSNALGDNRYKAIFSIFAALGLILIFVGYARAPAGPRLFMPFAGAAMVAPFAMIVSFVLLAAANMKTHIRTWIKHPMLIGVGIWALVHLLANGRATATLLFAAFLAYAVIDLISAVARNSAKSCQPTVTHEAIAIVAGVLLALLVMTFHRQLMGVAVVSWGG
jgi:uncharacterized membrane protein